MILYFVNDGKGGIISGIFDINVDFILNLNLVGQLFGWVIVYLGFLLEFIFIVNLNDYYIDFDGDLFIFSVILFDFDGLIVEENLGIFCFIVLKFGEYIIYFLVEDGKGGFILIVF